MSKHTPGPWFVYEDCSRVGAEGAKNVETGIAGKYLTESLFDRSGNLYNPHDARLIAVVPELLEALKHAVEIAENKRPGTWDDLLPYRVLIAKAEGANDD